MLHVAGKPVRSILALATVDDRRNADLPTGEVVDGLVDVLDVVRPRLFPGHGTHHVEAKLGDGGVEFVL